MQLFRRGSCYEFVVPFGNQESVLSYQGAVSLMMQAIGLAMLCVSLFRL